jgi:hypothetical protein
MTFGIRLALAGAILVPFFLAPPTPACAPASRSGKPVVNADQTVIIIWDADTKTEHFIRKASFTSEADDFGFLVPTPTQPELEESGDEAFPFLLKLTEPEKKRMPRPSSGAGCSCGVSPSTPAKHTPATGAGAAPPVHVQIQKEVAGFKAVVLETKSATALVNWLKENGYAFSPEVEAWAKPYVEHGWMITALKVAKDKEGKGQKGVAAAALRMTFKTDQPLFPYREPDSRSAAQILGANKRLLRIYLIAEARYKGELTREVPWTGEVAWANRLSSDDRQKALALLKLPETTGPADWWLTEFEDNWPYRVAPADVYFSRNPYQGALRRRPIIEYVSAPWPTDAMSYALAAVVVLPPLLRRMRCGRKREGRLANAAGHGVVS